MRVLLFTAICLFFWLFSRGQNAAVVLIIDTLIDPTNGLMVHIEKPAEYLLEEDYFTNIPVTPYKNQSPNVVTTIQRTDSLFESSSLFISLDDRGGWIELKDIFRKKQDTILIEKLTVFRNCLRDSLYGSKSWYREYSRNSDLEPKEKKRESYAKEVGFRKCNETYPDSFTLMVNHVLYIVPLLKEYETTIIHGHGYKKSARKVDLLRKKGKSYLRFFLSGVEKKAILSATVTIK